jgi:HK97 family phage prohead protease
MNAAKREIRFLSKKSEVRAKADGSKTISGYACLFNTPSQDLGGFIETIKPGAFTESLAGNPDVRCLFNHDENCILGRTTAGTLRLKEDSVGLFYECDLGNQTYATDLYESIKRGDVTQSSFGFYCLLDNWVPTGDSTQVLREVLKADVFDCSPVVFPAYTQSTINARSLFPDGVPTPRISNPRIEDARTIVEDHERYLRQQRVLQALLS